MTKSETYWSKNWQTVVLKNYTSVQNITIQSSCSVDHLATMISRLSTRTTSTRRSSINKCIIVFLPTFNLCGLVLRAAFTQKINFGVWWNDNQSSNLNVFASKYFSPNGHMSAYALWQYCRDDCIYDLDKIITKWHFW